MTRYVTCTHCRAILSADRIGIKQTLSGNHIDPAEYADQCPECDALDSIELLVQDEDSDRCDALEREVKRLNSILDAVIDALKISGKFVRKMEQLLGPHESQSGEQQPVPVVPDAGTAAPPPGCPADAQPSAALICWQCPHRDETPCPGERANNVKEICA